MIRDRPPGGSKLDTFNPLQSPSKHRKRDNSGSPELLGQSQLLHQQAMDLNNAAEKFMAELDQSDKKRYFEREQELTEMAAHRPGMVSALSKNFFGDMDNGASSSLGQHGDPRRASTTLNAESGMGAIPQDSSVQRISQSSHDTSKFRDADAPAHASDEGGKESPNPYGDVDRLTEAQNGEGTISRYLVGQGQDSVSRGGNNTLARNTGRDLDTNRNRASLELGQSSRHGSYKKSVPPEYLHQQSNQIHFGVSLQEPMNLDSLTKHVSLKQSSQGDLRAPAHLFSSENIQQQIQQQDGAHRDAEPPQEGQLSTSEIHKYQTVQPDKESIQPGIFGIGDVINTQHHFSNMAYANSNSHLPTLQSRDCLNVQSDNGLEMPKHRRDQFLQSPPDLAKQGLAQSTLSQQYQESAGVQPIAAMRVETFNGAASLDSSMALNQRIRKLREELDGNNNPLIQSDAQNSNMQASHLNYNYVTHVDQRSPQQPEESLDSRMRKAQMQTERLLEKARSRSPMSGSRVSHHSAIYVDTKRSQSKSISKVISNATDIELPLGKISDSHIFSKLTDETKNKYVVSAEEHALSVSKEAEDVQQVQLKASSPAPYKNLEVEYQDGGTELSSYHRRGQVKENSTKSNEPSLDRGPTHHSSSANHVGSSRKNINQKSASLRSRNLSYTNLHTMNSGTNDHHKSRASKKSLRSVSSRAMGNPKIRSKSVKFQRSGSQKQAKLRIDGGAHSGDFTTQDSVTLDKFYKELIKRERMEFERILKSKEMVIRHDTQSKLRKQIQMADQKFQRVTDLERQLAFAQKNCEKLRVEWSQMKSSLGQSKQQLEISQNENKVLRTKLDDLWEKYEEEKDLVMLVTKSEVEKAKSEEIALLREKIDVLEAEKSHAFEQLNQATAAEQDQSSKEAEASGLNAELQLFKSKCERFEIENKRLKEELEISQAAQMQELKQKYDSMKQKYKEMAKSSSGVRSVIDSQRMRNDIHADQIGSGKVSLEKTNNQSQPLLTSDKKLNLEHHPGRQQQRSDFRLQADELPPSARFFDQNASEQANRTESSNPGGQHHLGQARGSSYFNSKADQHATIKTSSQETFHMKQEGSREPSKSRSQKHHYNTTSGSQKPRGQEQAELWQLRCKLLAEKYFGIIKDLKRSLKKLKASNKMEIEKMRKEMSDQVLEQLRGYITRLEQKRTRSSRKGSVREERGQSTRSAGRARSGSQKQHSKKVSQETLRTQTNRFSSTLGKLNSDIEHLNEYSKESSAGTLQNAQSAQLDSVPHIPSTVQPIETGADAKSIMQRPEALNNLTPAFNSQSAELVDIQNQKADLELLIEQQQKQIDQQQDELDQLKERMDEAAVEQNEAQVVPAQYKAEPEPMLLSERKPRQALEAQTAVAEANGSEAARLSQQLKVTGLSQDSRQAAHASNVPSRAGTASLQGLSTTRYNVVTSTRANIYPNAIPSNVDSKVLESRALLHNTHKSIQENRSQERHLASENSQYRSKFAKNYNRLAALTGGAPSTHLSNDQKSQLDRIRSQHSSNSNSRDRSVHQIANLNGQQYQVASLRAPMHHYFPSQAGPESMPIQNFQIGLQKELTHPGSIQTRGSFSNTAGPPMLSNQALPTTSQASGTSFSAIANIYNLQRDDRSPSKCGEPWQRPVPQVLQGSPNSPFYEHLRQNRANSGSAARRNTSEHGRPAAPTHGQPAESMAPRALASQHFTTPSSMTNIYPPRSETYSDVGKIDATLSRIQHLNQASELASPKQEGHTAGGLGKQVGGYPMQFQPPEYYNIQEETSSRAASRQNDGDGNISFQHPTPPDNTISLAKFAQKEGTLSLDKFAQRMTRQEPAERNLVVRETGQFDSLDRGSIMASHKSAHAMSSARSNSKKQKQQAVPHLQFKSASLRYIDKNQQRVPVSATQASHQQTQQSMSAVDKRARASSTKSIKNSKRSRKHSTGVASSKSKSAKRSSKARTPKQGKCKQSVEQSKSSIKSGKSRRSSKSKSPRQGYGVGHRASASINDSRRPRREVPDRPDDSQFNRQQQSLSWQPANQALVQLHSQASALQSKTEEDVHSQPSLLGAPSGHQQHGYSGNQHPYSPHPASFMNEASNINITQAPSMPSERPPPGYAGVNMTTFERLNEEIQKSINSLKEMSQQKAFNMAAFSEAPINNSNWAEASTPAEQPAGMTQFHQHGDSVGTANRLSDKTVKFQKAVAGGAVTSKTQPSQESKSSKALSNKAASASQRLKKPKKADSIYMKDK